MGGAVGTLFKSLALAGTRTALVPHNLRATLSGPFRYGAFTSATYSAANATSAMLQNSVLKFQQSNSTTMMIIMVLAALYPKGAQYLLAIEREAREARSRAPNLQ
jgi:hypothetical protein